MFIRTGVWSFSACRRYNQTHKTVAIGASLFRSPRVIIHSLKSYSIVSQRAALERPRALPTSGYTTVDADTLVEEEELPDYQADRFYPVELGEIFQDRYQLAAKLGFGSSSTTWLARDLR